MTIFRNFVNQSHRFMAIFSNLINQAVTSHSKIKTSDISDRSLVRQQEQETQHSPENMDKKELKLP